MSPWEGSIAGDIVTVTSDKHGGTLLYWSQPLESWLTGTTGDWLTGSDWQSGVTPVALSVIWPCLPASWIIPGVRHK
jgi:hypothetical protein